MQNTYRSIARLDCLRLNIINKCSLSSFYKRAFSTQRLVPETVDMGKDKVAYQLKTPKGTKDCTLFSSIQILIHR